ncbi:baseplate J/gp47 family protein [Paraburkholderia graminis]|uniref:hypothetical protein n=1 Tax=Paraburkholderia graminis TaxID=60548 RepID=UPI0038BB9DFC
MKRDPPKIDTRRTEEFRGELLARARAWIHDWTLGETPGDFGAALLDAASRLSAQVAARLDRAGEKLSLGLLDWLAVRGTAALPARMPVALKLADTAREPVLAAKATRLQADVDGASVIFETEADVELVPGSLVQIVAVDTSEDAYYVPPSGLSSLEPLDPLPNRWTLRNFASQDAARLQLDPALGLAEDTLIEIAGHQYRITKVDGDLIDIDPPVQNAGGLPAPTEGPTEVTRVQSFDPFGPAAHNQQEHIVYLGDADLFNIEAEATLEILGTNNKLADATWQYFGKSATEDEARWRAMIKPEQKDTLPDALKLVKPAGALEPMELGAVKGARWIRARQVKVADEDGVLLTDALSVIVNRGMNKEACPSSSASSGTDPGAMTEGFINSTALVMNGVFYPLGKQPRQFDTFYLGCTDAFSKRNASVSICFEMADPAPASFAAVVSGIAANRMLVSAGADGALHVFWADPATGALSAFRGGGPLQPPGDAGAISLDRKPAYRLPVWTNDDNPRAATGPAAAFPGGGSTVAVAVSAGNAVWVWLEAYYWPVAKPWISYNAIPRGAAAVDAKIDALAYLPGPAPENAELYAAFDGKLFRHSALEDRAGQPWSEVQLTGDFAVGDKVRIISPVYELNGALPEPSRASGLVAVLEHDKGTFGVCVIELLEDAQQQGVCVTIESPATVVPETQPTAGRIADDYFVFWHCNDPATTPQSKPAQVRAGRITRTLGGGHSNWSKATLSTDQPSTDAKAAIVGGSFDIQKLDGKAALIVVTRNGDQSTLSTLAPFDAGSTALFEAPLPAGKGPLAGAATVFGRFVVAPGAHSDAWLGAWDPGARQKITVALKTGIVVAAMTPPLMAKDHIAIVATSTQSERTTITDVGPKTDSEHLYALRRRIGMNPATPQALLLAFRVKSANGATTSPADQTYKSGAVTAGSMTLDYNDHDARVDEWLLMKNGAQYRLRQVQHVDRQAPGGWQVTFTQPTGLTPANSVSYWHAEVLHGRIAPFFDLDPNGNGNWPASRLDDAVLLFDKSVPLRQHGKAFAIDPQKRPEIVVLDQPWETMPVSGSVYIDSSISAWQQQLGDNASNPELAWEYWTGTNWTQLSPVTDATLNLKQTGKLEFTVPVNLARTDVGGKVNYWIRARLVGGDYGQEQVKVITKPVGTDGTTEQTVQHLPADIRPPLVVRLRVRYALSNKVLPAYLLTQDSGSLRDQSDANRTDEAKVEAFVPLSLLMKRLGPVSAGEPPATSPAPRGHKAPTCSCGPETSAASAVPPDMSATDATTASPVNDARSILLGFDGMLLGEPVNVLLLNEERPHDEFAPLTVEALSRDRFEMLTVKDTTRALGESGLLSMSFPVQPSARELFGSSRAWLRLHPSRVSADAEWLPAIRGAYLNAVWARATETLTREALGSSDGRPALTLNLARPPLLNDSLELRVREPLDEEERKALLDADPATDDEARVVKFDLPDLPGDWVLWRQVPDPADYGPRDRVFALDESSGEVLFGDGIHGMIPPIGRDSICAFRYQRTEPAADGSDTVPANAVEARTALNLVTPVEGVEAAFAAEHAAGGSPPESTARVLRFGSARLRHRGRAVVPRDFEDLVRANSPNVAQAHAFRRAGGLRLVVVMAGAEPWPTAVQRRAFRRLLVEAAAPSFGEKAALTVDGPRVRRLRVHLALRVTSLDDAGETALDVKAALRRFFDTAAGGIDGEGWALGAAPADDDIAFALSKARGLEGIANSSFAEVGEDGAEIAWRPAMRDDELVLLDADPVRIVFQALETEA